MKKIIILGAGMVGSAMALDLAKKHLVTVADLNAPTLEKLKQRNNKIETLELNVKNKALLTSAIAPYELVLCAVPGFMGFETLKNILEMGKNVVDISFFPENALELDGLAKQKKITAIVDCGVAPGMGNIILGYHNEKMKLTDFECLVGGLPKVKKWPFNYKAPFSPVDVIEEYTRPARYVENGNIVVKPAMSDVEHIEMQNLGTLEAFNSDGLRSIIFTMPHIPNKKEKTLRYPGHIEKITALRDSGFFSTEPIKINGVDIKPLDFTSKILFNEWKLGETESEITVMRITLRGTESGVLKQIEYHLHDEYHSATKTSSMARTTGYTATAAVNLILEGQFNEQGVFPPELVGKHESCFNYFINYLKERNVMYTKTETVLQKSK